MTQNELLEGIRGCTCGQDHLCPIRELRVGGGAIKALPEITRPFRRILLTADQNTYAVGGAAVERLLGERIADRVIFREVGVLIPDERSAGILADAVRRISPDLILAIGSGVLNDLAKYVSHGASLPYVIVATAPSMDGYASRGAAMILDGMKVTPTCSVPYAIIGDTDLLCTAPIDMIRAGYGDIIGKLSCICDWRLSHLINGEPICERIAELTLSVVDRIVPLAEAISAREPEAIGSLFSALVEVGVFMAYVGNSRPASGSEHHLAHFFEITGILRSTPYLSHGIDVCCGAVITAELRQRLLSSEAPCADTPRPIDKEALRSIYGSLFEEILALQERVGFYRKNRMPIYREKWGEIREILASAPSPEQMLRLLSAAGISFSDFLATYPREHLHDAVLYAKDLKDRFTVLHLYYDLAQATP